MMSWMRQYAAWLLFAGLVALLLANAWLFLPRYVLQQQKLTPDSLHEQAQQMVRIANDSADWATKVANGQVSGATATNADLLHLQQRADDVVVKLQHAPFEVSLGDKVKQYLQLAQVLSFTLHDLGFSLSDKLKVSQTAQVLRQAAMSAAAL